MGCDIHLFVETKVDEKWILVDHPDVNRNYDLFEKMAGVRGETYNALAQPRGLPSDVSEGTMLHYIYWGADAHTPSWLSRIEIAELEKWLRKHSQPGYFSPFGYMFGNGFSLDEEDIRDTVVTDIRFVFWFDN